MLKPLFISRDYLFAHSPNGECLRSFMSGMGKEEWQPIVYGSDKQPLVGYSQYDYRLTHEKRYVQYLAALVRRVFIPDLTWLPGYEWSAWGKGAAKRIIKDINSGALAPDYVHSISYPVASHWAALKVKRATGLPWVMQLYDPWADNPYRPFRTEYLKKKDWKMEAVAVKEADLIIHTNEKIAGLWRERYGEEVSKKIIVLPLTTPIPSVPVSPVVHQASEPIVISHIGNFMLNRRAEPFLRALSKLLIMHPDYRSKIKVNFIGTVPDEDKKLIEEKELNDIVKLHGTLPIEECEPFYKNSDLFLVIDGINPNNIFFPSKILKYFYFQRPILGISPTGSVLDEELSASGHCCFDNNDIDGISECLNTTITDYAKLCRFDAGYWKRFEASSVVNAYKEAVTKMLDK